MGHTELLGHLTWYIASWKPGQHPILYRMEKPVRGNMLHTKKITVNSRESSKGQRSLFPFKFFLEEGYRRRGGIKEAISNAIP